MTHHGGSRHLSRDDLLLHLLGEGVLEGEVVAPVDQQLVLQVLRGVEVLASRLLTVAPALQSSICEIFSVIFVSKVLQGINFWKSPFYDGADWYDAVAPLLAPTFPHQRENCKVSTKKVLNWSQRGPLVR